MSKAQTTAETIRAKQAQTARGVSLVGPEGQSAKAW